MRNLSFNIVKGGRLVFSVMGLPLPKKMRLYPPWVKPASGLHHPPHNNLNRFNTKLAPRVTTAQAFLFLRPASPLSASAAPASYGFIFNLLLLILFCPTPLYAHSPGGVFAGPARASGSSLYWNGAALVLGLNSAPTANPQKNNTAAIIHTDLAAGFASLSYTRTGTDPNTLKKYPKVGFSTPIPGITFSAIAPTPIPWLNIIGGGFSLNAAGTKWPKDGPQRNFGTSTLILSYSAVAGVLLTDPNDPTWAISIFAGPTYTTLQMNNAYDFAAFINQSLPPGADLFSLEDPTFEGELHIRASGYSMVSALGVWAKPFSWWQFGAQLMLPTGAVLHGDMRVVQPDAFGTALPGVNLAPAGNFSLAMPAPWQFSMENEFSYNRFHFTLLYEYINRSIQNILYAEVTETEPDLVSGVQRLAKGVKDDWAIGTRISYDIDSQWEVGGRIHYDKRSIPDEFITPINLDFTIIDFEAGALWRWTKQHKFAASITYSHIPTMHITQSMFNPRAPSNSGLSSPSGNGIYGASIMRLDFGYSGSF